MQVKVLRSHRYASQRHKIGEIYELSNSKHLKLFLAARLVEEVKDVGGEPESGDIGYINYPLCPPGEAGPPEENNPIPEKQPERKKRTYRRRNTQSGTGEKRSYKRKDMVAE